MPRNGHLVGPRSRGLGVHLGGFLHPLHHQGDVGDFVELGHHERLPTLLAALGVPTPCGTSRLARAVDLPDGGSSEGVAEVGHFGVLLDLQRLPAGALALLPDLLGLVRGLFCDFLLVLLPCELHELGEDVALVLVDVLAGAGRERVVRPFGVGVGVAGALVAVAVTPRDVVLAPVVVHRLRHGAVANGCAPDGSQHVHAGEASLFVGYLLSTTGSLD